MRIVQKNNGKGGGAQIPRRIITHAIGEFVDDGNIAKWSPDFITTLGLSAHYYITPSGVVIQQRAEHLMAWHAKGNNDGTIGVEWMVPGVHDYETFLETIKTDWVSDNQFNAGVDLYKSLIKRLIIEDNQRHSDIDPQRKKDPGEGFPWAQLLHTLDVARV